MKREIISMFLMTLLVIGALTVFGNVEIESKTCGSSKYNIYSNSTRGYTKIFKRCYVKVPFVYESTKECGFLGISCYETEPRPKMDYGTVCFKLKTGERC